MYLIQPFHSSPYLYKRTSTAPGGRCVENRTGLGMKGKHMGIAGFFGIAPNRYECHNQRRDMVSLTTGSHETQPNRRSFANVHHLM